MKTGRVKIIRRGVLARALCGAAALCTLLAASPAQAHGIPDGLFHAEGALLVPTLHLSPAGNRADFGGVELQASASVVGLGLMAGLRFVQVASATPHSSAVYHGGDLNLALQLRPMALAAISGKTGLAVRRWFDPFAELGFLVGGLDAGGHASGYGSVGADLTLVPLWLIPGAHLEGAVVLVGRCRGYLGDTADIANQEAAFGLGFKLVI